MAEASRPSERMIRGTDEQVRHSAFVIGGGAEHHVRRDVGPPGGEDHGRPGGVEDTGERGDTYTHDPVGESDVETRAVRASGTV